LCSSEIESLVFAWLLPCKDSISYLEDLEYDIVAHDLESFHFAESMHNFTLLDPVALFISFCRDANSLFFGFLHGMMTFGYVQSTAKSLGLSVSADRQSRDQFDPKWIYHEWSLDMIRL
jgi:hypothetical protein